MEQTLEETSQAMSDRTPEERHREDSHNGGDDEMENKNDKEAYHTNTSHSTGHGTPEEHHRDREDSDSPSVVVNCGGGGKENGDGCHSSSSASSMAKGLSVFISSIMEDYDSRAEATSGSQDQLTFALDRLTGELDQLLDDAPLPFIMQHAARISGVKKRVKSLNLVLKSIQRRVDNMDRIMSTGSPQGHPGPNS